MPTHRRVSSRIAMDQKRKSNPLKDKIMQTVKELEDRLNRQLTNIQLDSVSPL